MSSHFSITCLIPCTEDRVRRPDAHETSAGERDPPCGGLHWEAGGAIDKGHPEGRCNRQDEGATGLRRMARRSDGGGRGGPIADCAVIGKMSMSLSSFCSYLGT